MPVTVSRHELPTDTVGNASSLLEVLGGGLTQSLSRVESSPRTLARALATAETVAQVHCLLDPTASKIETWEAFITAMQTSSAIFAAANSTEGSIQCRIDHNMRTIPATGPQYYTDAGTWITAFWLSVICRESSRLDMLSAIPLDLLRSSGAIFDDYIYPWVDTLQTSWRERSVPLDKLLEALNETDPETLRVAPRELILKILSPPLEMFLYYVREDSERFNASLVQALELHKQYWTADEERATDPTGLVAIGPLAVACLAHDAGVIPIEVESDYLPKHLLLRSWLGEFDT
ncbi:immunity 49 family protein [Streptomyces sp. NBC_00433]